MAKSNLGAYLFTSRIRRGFNNIAEYLKEHDPGVSESYYRDLETGRKILRLESASSLCAGLRLEKRPFFASLLKDVLPEDVATELLKPDALEVFDSKEAEIARQQEEIDRFRRAYMRNIGDSTQEVSEEIVSLLNDRISWLPIIHFIYMRNSCVFKDLERIIRANNIDATVRQVTDFLRLYQLADVDEANKSITRHGHTFRIPGTKKGRAFKDRFLTAEIEKSLTKKRASEVGLGKSTWTYSTIVCVNKQNLAANLAAGVANLAARIEGDQCALEDPDAQPMFACVILSSREEYC